jgi:hypothetical protein
MRSRFVDPRLPREELLDRGKERDPVAVRCELDAGESVTLSIALKTVDNHIQSIYSKIGVSARASAAMFAMRQHLLD